MKRPGGAALVKLPCIRCKKSFSPGGFFEVLYCDEGIYFFCSEYCRDNVTSDVVLLKESKNLNQSSAGERNKPQENNPRL
jgi:hypothetical protein